jgi:hypothetical protein
LRQGKVGVHVGSDPFIDVGNPGLYWEAHFQLIEKLEAGELPDAWSSRLHRVNRNPSPGVWVDRALEVDSNSRLVPPTYLSLGVSAGPVSSESRTVAYRWEGLDQLSGLVFGSLRLSPQELQK